MDLLIALVICVSISFYKTKTQSVDTTIQSTVVTEFGELETTTIKSSELQVGNNLMLLKEPRAYHKIVDELGLAK